MRFRLILEVNRKAFGDILPINYQYEQSSAVYKILSRVDKSYSTWLHDRGYMLDSGKKFKLFTYSRFKINKRRIIPDTDRLQILSNTIEWQISFLPEESNNNFILGILMDQVFEIGDHISKVQFIIRNVEVLPSPEFLDDMTFRTMSPMCIQYINPETKEKKYLSPNDKRAKFLLLNGLNDRYLSYYGKALNFSIDNCSLDILDIPKSHLITIRANSQNPIQVRGFICTFKIHAPKELLQLMYESGAGYLCAQGFGCLRIIS